MSRPTIGNRELLRDLNRNQVLNVSREAGQISHRDLTKLTGLSKATVTSIVGELKGEGFLEIIGAGESKLGRKPILMRFNYGARYVVSATFFADKTQLAIVDLGGTIVDRLDLETVSNESLGVVIKRFASNARELLGRHEILMERVLGVGACFEGSVDSSRGVLVLSSRSGWKDVPVRALIESEFGVKTIVDTEAAAMTMGEYRHGAGQNYNHIVCVDLDAGIGSIELQDGNICHGSHYMAGEIGHSPVIHGGPMCNCGKRGCLEAMASGWAILARIRRGIEEGVSFSFSEDMQSPVISVAIRAVFEAARKGDEFVLKIINEAAQYLSMAIAGVINYADPKLVILTGWLVDESDGMLLDLIREFSQEYVLDSGLRKVEIEEGELGSSAALIGAADMVCEQAFRAGVSQ